VLEHAAEALHELAFPQRIHCGELHGTLVYTRAKWQKRRGSKRLASCSAAMRWRAIRSCPEV
jgi:hypothetical protein